MTSVLFTSILFPSYARSGRGIRIREVPLDRIAECMTSRTTLVAVSAVQSADGRVADLDALHAASRATGVRVLLATTEAVGVAAGQREPLRLHRLRRIQMAAVPQRRTACFTINRTLIDDLTPHYAGWYAGEDPWTTPPSAGGPPTCGDRSGAVARMPGEAGQLFEERGSLSWAAAGVRCIVMQAGESAARSRPRLTASAERRRHVRPG
jgi:hypothetical protein